MRDQAGGKDASGARLRIDRVAAAAETMSSADRPVLRMENLDTNLPLPPEAVSATVAGLHTPESNSWLPFTGDLGLRSDISEFTAARSGHVYDPEREIVITSGGMEGLFDVVLALIDPGDEVVVTDPTYAGIVNRIRLAGGVPVSSASVCRSANGGSIAMHSRRPLVSERWVCC